MRKLIQADFYPKGRVVYYYDDGTKVIKQSEIKGITPKQALQKRLEEHKKQK